MLLVPLTNIYLDSWSGAPLPGFSWGGTCVTRLSLSVHLWWRPRGLHCYLVSLLVFPELLLSFSPHKIYWTIFYTSARCLLSFHCTAPTPWNTWYIYIYDTYIWCIVYIYYILVSYIWYIHMMYCIYIYGHVPSKGVSWKMLRYPKVPQGTA